MAYEKKRLLSRFEIARLFRKAGFDSLDFLLPVITAVDWENLRGVEKWGARLFSWAAKAPLLRSALGMISPVIQMVARHRNQGPQEDRPVPVDSIGAAR